VALEQAIATFAQEFERFYRQYLDELGQSVRRQLILASYYLCTQSYPEPFLDLSVSQRESLQRSLRQLAKTAQGKLLGYLEPPEASASQPPDEPPQAPPTPDASASNLDEGQAIAAIDLTNFSVPELSELSEPPELSDLSELEDLENRPDASDSGLGNPDVRRWFPTSVPAVAASGGSDPDQPSELAKLARWKAHIDDGISETLQELSQAANHLLYQAAILPNQLPESLLEAATKSGMAAEMSSGHPNVLKLMIEAKSEHAVSIAQIMVVRLQLLDIEEADYALRGWSSKLRGISQRLTQLGRDYRRKRHERAIAQSEEAWRAIWFED
jgi:hypothetical protein